MLIGQRLQRAEERVPAAVPLREQLVPRHGAPGEFLVPLPPWLLAVGGEEIGEARSQVAADVPDEDGGRIRPVLRIADVQLLVFELRERGITQRFVAAEFSDD